MLSILRLFAIMNLKILFFPGCFTKQTIDHKNAFQSFTKTQEKMKGRNLNKKAVLSRRETARYSVFLPTPEPSESSIANLLS